MAGAQVSPAPAVREPLPQQPRKAPRHSSVTGEMLFSRPRWCWPFSGVQMRYQRSPGPVRVGHSIDFRGAPPAGCEGWQARSKWSIPGVPPALDRSPCGRVLRAQAQNILSPNHAREAIGGGVWKLDRVKDSPQNWLTRSRFPRRHSTGFPETSGQRCCNTHWPLKASRKRGFVVSERNDTPSRTIVSNFRSIAPNRTAMRLHKV